MHEGTLFKQAPTYFRRAAPRSDAGVPRVQSFAHYHGHQAEQRYRDNYSQVDGVVSIINQRARGDKSGHWSEHLSIA